MCIARLMQRRQDLWGDASFSLAQSREPVDDARMSLTHAILATLVDGPHHAYRIRRLAADLLGPFFAVNQGQVYATLHRLATRGLVDVAPPERSGGAAGTRATTSMAATLEKPVMGATSGGTAPCAPARHIEPRRFRLTPRGRQELERWLAEPSETPGGAIDLASRLVAIVARGDADGARRLLRARRTRLRGLVAMVERLPLSLCDEAWLGGRSRLRTAARRAILSHLEAELAWLDLAERAVATRLDSVDAISPDRDPTPRGRP